MNKYMFPAIATALLISPLAVNALPSNPGTNNSTESRLPITQLAHRNQKGGHGNMKKLLEQLDLTPEQSQKIDAIHEEFHSENETLFQEMRSNHQELRSLLASDASQEQLRQQHQKIQNLRQQLGTNRFETMLQVRELLTPEQRTQMSELMAQYRGRRGHHNFQN
ncbi:P pilus assembly/Cpx signaling pathway, periplasmic inhibitor/zinc-resistance associated protein [Xenococcus sp. PCC 7305]|uniref:Spy/CpxP family protein refolding chaperone n=1 Tax=Xenococcus sp. PCC 7305 TaxID=102125 RepID=UPI0002ACFBCD|nr:Spy/CpxP family protein refolding chaperone [Xenococcus sp. PCC 7305]ELS00838.1 P pilus assembly/Cpx signaling pathway, periplasmic inhibitor/zinc-resistance associated protein [Xenococcus sp. PCC 7305]